MWVHVDRLSLGTVTLGAGLEDRSPPQETRERADSSGSKVRQMGRPACVRLAHWWLWQGLCPLQPHSS